MGEHTDETYIGGANVIYSYDNGTTWVVRPLSRTSGTTTDAQWSSYIPAPYTPVYVWYYYDVWDRAANNIRYPTTGQLWYRSTDKPHIANITVSPSIINATGSTVITTDVYDFDGVTDVKLAYRKGTGTETVVSMTQGSGDSWSATISNLGTTSRVYFHITATELLGYTVNSTDRWFIVDDTDPFFTTTGFDPTYPNATNPTTVSGTANDGLSSMDVWMDYKYGASGTEVTSYMGTGGHQEYVDRNPTTGTTTATLNRNYYTTSGSVVGRVTLRLWSDDHASNYIYLRGYKGSSWSYIISPTVTTDGIKFDGSVEASGYDRLYIYFYDQNRDPFYYEITYTEVSDDFSHEVPAPTYSTWVYYRIRGTDQVGNSNTSSWAMYWADGTEPGVTAHKPPGGRDSNTDVTVLCTFADDSRIERAQIFYSYGTNVYYWVNMTQQWHNGTHLGASAVVPKTSIPLTVYYYFRSFDSAGNNNTSRTYQFTTKMRNLQEGIFAQFDSSVLESVAGMNKWEWDFDYNGTFNVDRTNQVVRYRYYDNGTYNIKLKVYDKGGNVTNITFTVVVLDLSPTAGIYEVGTVDEGTIVTLDGSYSSSWPDEIVSWEWDLDYDGS
ncbi:MAG: PKD domain-containing protein, partial [Planctomycetota bacterium]